MTEEKKFQSKDELEEWLKSRGADEKHSASAADMLSQKGITLSSELIGMSTQDLRYLGLDLIPANHLSNKLKDQPQQHAVHVAAQDPKQDDTAAKINAEKIWNSVLRIRSDVEGDVATALVFDVYESYLYLLMNYHYKMSSGNTYYVEYCSSDNTFLEVDFFEFHEFQTFAESDECDFVIRKVWLDPETWEVGKGISIRRPVNQPQTKRPRREAAKTEIKLKAEVVCKTPSFSYEGVQPFEHVKVFGLPHAVPGRWVAETQVQNVDYRCFYVQALSAPGGSGGAVLATTSGLVVGFVGGANDYKNLKPKQLSSFNTYVMNTHSLPRRPSSAPNSPSRDGRLKEE